MWVGAFRLSKIPLENELSEKLDKYYLYSKKWVDVAVLGWRPMEPEQVARAGSQGQEPEPGSRARSQRVGRAW